MAGQRWAVYMGGEGRGCEGLRGCHVLRCSYLMDKLYNLFVLLLIEMFQHRIEN